MQGPAHPALSPAAERGFDPSAFGRFSNRWLRHTSYGLEEGFPIGFAGIAPRGVQEIFLEVTAP